jgi:hypothetical protein
MNKILFVGSNPPPLKRPLGPDGMTATTRRLNLWMEAAGVTAHAFTNVIPYHVEVEHNDHVDWDRVKERTKGFDRIIALGSFPSSVLARLKISHLALPHPSPRNRKFNDKSFEPTVVSRLKSYVS